MKDWNNTMPTSLRGIANKAAQNRAYRFRNLFGLLNAGFLLWSWRFVNKRAAAGVDRVSARTYEHDLAAHVDDLADSVKGRRYRAK